MLPTTVPSLLFSFPHMCPSISEISVSFAFVLKHRGENKYLHQIQLFTGAKEGLVSEGVAVSLFNML